MAEVGISVAAKVAEYFVDPAIQRLQYLFCVGKITGNFETKKEELIFKQRMVQERVQEALNRTERINDEVKKWENEVESLVAQVVNIEQELRASSSCFQRWCPTWRRYCLCRKLAMTTQRMTELNTKSDQLNPFSLPVIVPDIEYHSSKDFVFFKSTEMASDQLWEALHNDGCLIIGLWGMGGSGKTTLVKEVGKKAKESKLFDRVVITTISQTPNIRKIQGEMADLLGLKFEEETEAGRARRLAMRLQSSKERILIILDDVWAKLNLEDIGNPFGEEGPSNCKVLLTTRRQEVCTLMECQKPIPLCLLTEDEAWTLFQTHARVDDGVGEVVAREVAKECKGLPIAIVAMGTCLKGKGVDEMKVVLDKLKHSKPINVDEGVRDAFVCLELSYNYLRTSEAKLLLLMCAMFPEDHKIIIEDLFRYGVGLGLFKDADSFEIARSQITTAINVLIDSSLLIYSLHSGNEKCVMMHDMVRDVALWIASKEHRIIMVNYAKELNELLKDEAVKDCYAVSSWNGNSKLLQFPCRWKAPKLEILLLNSRKPLDLSHAFIEGVKGLKVLAMIGEIYSDLSLKRLIPQPIQWLSNIRTLRLQEWNLGDISFVVSLIQLEILDLQGCKLEKLPNGIEKLNHLKLLDLSMCTADECCCKVIGGCLQLEELYAPTNFLHLRDTNCYECLVDIPALPKLRRYIFEMGERNWFKIWNEGTRVLTLGQLNISISSAIITDLVQRATAIEFYELQGGCKSFIPDMVQAVGGMNELTKLGLRSCSEFECLTDRTTHHEDFVVPRLVELELISLDYLKQLCFGPSLLSLFRNLESLKLENCPQLHNMFPADCNLGNLRKLSISNCPMLTSLFPISVACTLLSLEMLIIEHCNMLKHVIEGEGGSHAWNDPRFPRWEILSVHDCCQLDYVCPIFCVQGFIQLKHLSIKNAPQLKFVFGEHGEEPLIYDQNETQMVLPLLEDFELENLRDLLRICSKSYHPRWPSIKNVWWMNCPRLNTSCDSLIIGSELRQPNPNMARNGHQLRNEESKPLAAVSNTESIGLHGCGVVSIFHYQSGCEVKKAVASIGPNLIIQMPVKFQYLKNLMVENCGKLKIFFSAGICQSLPELTYIKISNCVELEECFVEHEQTEKKLSQSHFCLPKLESLSIWGCSKLRIVFSVTSPVDPSMLPQLRLLSISDAPQLEEIFRCSNIDDHDIDSEKETTFPNLKIIRLYKLPRLVNVCQGFNMHTVESCSVLVHKCSKFLPIVGAQISWTEEKLERKYVLKCSHLSNNAALTLPLSVLNSEDFDIESSIVQDSFQVIGDYDHQQLKNLKMLRFEQQTLKGLVPTQGFGFQYLHSLKVIRSEKLKFLFSVSIIVYNSLPKLTSLTLMDCEELEEIITDDDEEPQIMSSVPVRLPELRELEIKRCKMLKRLFCTTNNGEEIVLPNLMKIKLKHLPNLINVCQGFKLQAEQIGNIFICKCPKFLDPVLGSTQMVSLQQWRTMRPQVPVEISDFHNGANVEKQLPVSEEKGMIMISSVETLSLKHLVNLMTVWEGPTLISFQNLRRLRVFGCRKLKSIFPGSVVRSLPCLKFLYIEECEELEEIILERQEQEHHFPTTSSNFLCFPKLARLEVSRCSKLKFLFCLASDGDFSKLQYLEIKECAQLEQLFSVALEIHKEGSLNHNVLPKLKELILEDLPNLTDICGDLPFQLKFQPLWLSNVKDCPIFSKTTFAALQGPKAESDQESTLSCFDIYPTDYEGGSSRSLVPDGYYISLFLH